MIDIWRDETHLHSTPSPRYHGEWVSKDRSNLDRSKPSEVSSTVNDCGDSTPWGLTDRRSTRATRNPSRTVDLAVIASSSVDESVHPRKEISEPLLSHDALGMQSTHGLVEESAELSEAPADITSIVGMAIAESVRVDETEETPPACKDLPLQPDPKWCQTASIPSPSSPKPPAPTNAAAASSAPQQTPIVEEAAPWSNAPSTRLSSQPDWLFAPESASEGSQVMVDSTARVLSASPPSEIIPQDSSLPAVDISSEAINSPLSDTRERLVDTTMLSRMDLGNESQEAATLVTPGLDADMEPSDRLSPLPQTSATPIHLQDRKPDLEECESSNDADLSSPLERKQKRLKTGAGPRKGGDKTSAHGYNDSFPTERAGLKAHVDDDSDFKRALLDSYERYGLDKSRVVLGSDGRQVHPMYLQVTSASKTQSLLDDPRVGKMCMERDHLLLKALPTMCTAKADRKDIALIKRLYSSPMHSVRRSGFYEIIEECRNRMEITTDEWNLWKLLESLTLVCARKHDEDEVGVHTSSFERGYLRLAVRKGDQWLEST